MTCLQCDATIASHALFCSDMCAFRYRLGTRPASHWCDVCHTWVAELPYAHRQSQYHRAATFLYAQRVVYKKALVYG